MANDRLKKKAIKRVRENAKVFAYLVSAQILLFAMHSNMPETIFGVHKNFIAFFPLTTMLIIFGMPQREHKA